ncbi:HopJ type III effector protein [Sphingobacteriaceae bacterium WQ 2009]|uniref:HopJ type III effector protein n=1 Tax=Rhinopithecimicrobium faecis TaxID=2820698 RepID=A0A8T4HHY0_9SPHI|nr:HopJ type III effector protein [Sphingobacteriaceae bacterium WQ 2009]
MNTTLKQLLASDNVCFAEVIQHIDHLYAHTPTAFSNGAQQNAATENQGSAKVFFYAHLHKLSEADTLAMFVEHYESVKNTPTGDNHQNIRQFMEHGWSGIHFQGVALQEK